MFRVVFPDKLFEFLRYIQIGTDLKENCDISVYIVSFGALSMKYYWQSVTSCWFFFLPPAPPLSLCLSDSVLPPYLQYPSQTSPFKSSQLALQLLVCSPRFRCIEKGRPYIRLVDPQLGLDFDGRRLPNIVQLLEGNFDIPLR